MIRAPPAVTLGPLWSVLTSCSVTFSQLPPSESNRDLYHGPRDGCMGPYRRRTAGLQCSEKTPLYKGFRSRNRVVESGQMVPNLNTERTMNF